MSWDEEDSTMGHTQEQRLRRRRRGHGAARRRPRRPGDRCEAPGGTRRALHGRRARRSRQGDARRGAAERPRRLGAGAPPAGSGRAARGAGQDPCPGARADPLRPHARLAVHVLPRCRLPDGVRSRDRAADGTPHPALRRRASVELRRLCGTGPEARLQPQRLRRDAPRPVRMGRQAARRELRRRRARPRLQREGAGGDQPRGRLGRTARTSGPSPRCANLDHLVLADRHRRTARAYPRGVAPQGREGREAPRGRTSPRAGRRTA